MTINRKVFFDGVRQQPFPGKLTKGQVDGMTAILDEWERRKLTDLRWLGYMFGTTTAGASQTLPGAGFSAPSPDRVVVAAFTGSPSFARSVLAVYR